MSFPVSSTPGIYRLVSTQLTTGVKTGSLNDNVTFVTNIPSLDFALRIWRTRLWNTFSGTSGLGTVAVNESIQLFAQLTENQTKTSVAVTDSAYLDEYNQQLTHDAGAATAASIDEVILWNNELIHDFNPVTTPWTVATKLNFVVSAINVGVSTFNAGWTWKPLMHIEYTLERLTADLRDYLSKRLQIQGS